MLSLFLSGLLVTSPTGGVFSGPTHVNGSTIYWSPAVLGHVRESTLIMAEGILYQTNVTYDRRPEDPTTEPDYPPVSFHSLTPDLCTTFLTDVPSRELRIFGGTFSPSGGGTRWPKDGPQRYQGTFGNNITYGGMLGLIWSPTSRISFAAGGGPLYFNLKLENAYDFGAFINSKLTPGADLFALEDPALEGYLKIGLMGWAPMGSFSAYARLLDNLEVAANFFIAGTAHLHGYADVQGPAALRDALPNLVVNPRGKLLLDYNLPWFINFETQLTLDRWQIATLVQFQRRSRQRVLVARVVESKSDFIEGDQLSLREVHDQWLLGTRVSRQLTDSFTLAMRGDVTPRYTPKEAVTAVNLNFTLLEADIGGRIRLSERSALEITIGAIYGVPVNVDRSIFNPRADPTSGLAQSSPIGRYSAFGEKLMISFATAFGD